MVGYDGGRVAAEGLADRIVDFPLPAHPPDPGGASERLSRAPGAGRVGVRWLRSQISSPAANPGPGPRAWSGGRLPGLRLPVRSEIASAGSVLNDAQRSPDRGRGGGGRVEAFVAGLPGEAPPLAAMEEIAADGVTPTGEDGFVVASSDVGGDPDALVWPTPPPAPIAWRSCSIPAIADFAIRSSTAPTAPPLHDRP